MPPESQQIPDYGYRNAEMTWSNHYLWGVLSDIVANQSVGKKRVFELGCGNGATSGWLAQQGFETVSVDTSESGIAIARKAHPDCKFDIGSAYDDLAMSYGQFPLVISLEVIEHCFWPRKFVNSIFDLLEPGGTTVISTPYHGYIKNLLLALSNRMDQHFTALWDGGHIKFWSEKTLMQLLDEAGFVDIQFRRAGRIAPIAKSMLAIAKKPQ